MTLWTRRAMWLRQLCLVRGYLSFDELWFEIHFIHVEVLFVGALPALCRLKMKPQYQEVGVAISRFRYS